MTIVGGIFRRHCQARVPWEVEKNLVRLESEWSDVTGAAIVDLRSQAMAWAHQELATLSHVIAHRPDQIVETQVALIELAT
jgi:hypothetical protein